MHNWPGGSLKSMRQAPTQWSGFPLERARRETAVKGWCRVEFSGCGSRAPLACSIVALLPAFSTAAES